MHTNTPKFKAWLAILVVASCSAVGRAATIDLNSWTQDLGTTSSNLSTNAPTLGNGTSNSANNQVISDAYAPISLLNVNDSATFTGAFTLTLTSTAGADQFRFGIYNHNASATTSGWTGYFGTNSAGTSAGALRAHTGDANVYYTTGGATSLNTHLATGSPAFAAGNYTFSMSVTKVASGTQIDYTILGSGYTFDDTFTDTTTAAGANYTYDRMGLIAGGITNASSIAFSNLQITTTPEPASLCLVGLSVVSLFLRRARRG